MAKTDVYGIDIGNKSTRIALVHNGKKPKILSLDAVATPENTMAADGGIVNPVPIGESLKLFFSGKNIKLHDMALSLNSSQAVIREFNVPAMPEKEVRSAVEFQLSQRFPGIVNTHGLSIKTIQNSDTGISGVVAFCPNKAVQTSQTLMGNILLPLKYLDTQANAVAKALTTFAGIDKTGSFISIHFGFLTTHIVLVHKGQAILNRFIESGSDAFDKLIAGNFNVTNAEAEEIKLGKHAVTVLDQREKESFLRLGLIPLEEQVRHIFEFFSYGKYAGTIGRIYLTGAASAQEGIEAYLTDIFNTKTEQAQGKTGDRDVDKRFHEFVVAIGTAIREDL